MDPGGNTWTTDFVIPCTSFVTPCTQSCHILYPTPFTPCTQPCWAVIGASRRPGEARPFCEFSRNAEKWKYYRVRGKIRYINGKYEFEVRLGFVVGVQKLLILIVSMTGWNLIISRMHSFYKSWSTVNPFQKNMIVRRRLWLQLENVVTSFHYYIVLILKSICIFQSLNFLCNYIFSK